MEDEAVSAILQGPKILQFSQMAVDGPPGALNRCAVPLEPPREGIGPGHPLRSRAPRWAMDRGQHGLRRRRRIPVHARVG